ncbi:hypothetical protein C8R45DRAFT_386511 [Mycena sanguinolenta]|nr:hypothetical protein C8R45DRAFT_386511 [Mycena sanguinolenta]
MNICSTWTAIALSTPRLWSAVVIDFNRPEALRQLLPTWLQRAGKHPLSISFRGIFRSHHIPPIVWLYCEQLKELELAHEELDSPSHDSQDDHTEIPDIFGDVTPEPLPLLQRLTIHNEGDLRGFLQTQIFHVSHPSSCITRSATASCTFTT